MKKAGVEKIETPYTLSNGLHHTMSSAVILKCNAQSENLLILSVPRVRKSQSA
jgi:hypothetical protein